MEHPEVETTAVKTSESRSHVLRDLLSKHPGSQKQPRSPKRSASGSVVPDQPGGPWYRGQPVKPKPPGMPGFPSSGPAITLEEGARRAAERKARGGTLQLNHQESPRSRTPRGRQASPLPERHQAPPPTVHLYAFGCHHAAQPHVVK